MILLFLALFLACSEIVTFETGLSPDPPTLSTRVGNLEYTPPTPIHTGHTGETADQCPASGYIAEVSASPHPSGVLVLIRGEGEICYTVSGPPGAEGPCFVAEPNLSTPAVIRIKPKNSLFCEITTTAGVVRWTR